MKFSIEIHKRALKDIKDMPPSNMEKFKELINTLETNPFPKNKFDIKRLKGNDEIYRKYKIIRNNKRHLNKRKRRQNTH